MRYEEEVLSKQAGKHANHLLLRMNNPRFISSKLPTACCYSAIFREIKYRVKLFQL